MTRFNRRDFVLAGGAVTLSMGAMGCDPKASDVAVGLTIDWVPSAEYYGFFVAKRERLFAKHALNVTVHNGSGAPVVASQLAAGAIYLGTTTSDNLVRIIEKGAKIARAAPILPYNPTALIMKPGFGADLRSLQGKVIGVNVQSAGYLQFRKALSLAGIAGSSFTEYPIGFGGVEEFMSGRVDAIVGYTSNHAVDLALRNVPHDEVRLDRLGIHSAGLVLVATDEAVQKMGASNLNALFDACVAGYQLGGSRPDLAVASLAIVDASLNPAKGGLAVRKIAGLMQEPAPAEYDRWLIGQPGISEGAIVRTNLLLRSRE